MKDIVVGTIQLSRYTEVVGIVCALSLLGSLLAEQPTRPSLVVLALVANFLAITFAAMFNDIEDAEDDGLDENKVTRNPVTSGKITKGYAYSVSAFVAVCSMAVYACLPVITMLVGASLLLSGFLYSWRPVRVKAIAGADVLVHGYFLAAGILLASYTATAQRLSFDAVLAGAAVYLISIGGDLHNEVRDYEADRNARLRNTAALLGLDRTRVLKHVFTLSGVLMAAWVGLRLLPRLHLPSVVAALAVACFLVVRSFVSGGAELRNIGDSTLGTVLVAMVSAVLAISVFAR